MDITGMLTLNWIQQNERTLNPQESEERKRKSRDRQREENAIVTALKNSSVHLNIYNSGDIITTTTVIAIVNIYWI